MVSVEPSATRAIASLDRIRALVRVWDEAIRLPLVLARVMLNVAIDAGIGALPLLGDLFDIGWRANRRNLDLLERWLAAPTVTTRSGRLVLGAAAAATLGVIGAVGWLLVITIRAVLS